MENTEEMRYAVFSITNRELLFACYCDKTPCVVFDMVTFLTKRFCKKNEGFSKREFFIRYPKLTRSSDELLCLVVTYLRFRVTFFDIDSVVSSVSQHFQCISSGKF